MAVWPSVRGVYAVASRLCHAKSASPILGPRISQKVLATAGPLKPSHLNSFPAPQSSAQHCTISTVTAVDSIRSQRRLIVRHTQTADQTHTNMNSMLQGRQLSSVPAGGARCLGARHAVPRPQRQRQVTRAVLAEPPPQQPSPPAAGTAAAEAQPYDRMFNFSAGPAVLPVPVLEQAQADLLNYHNSGSSVMEMSHRGKEFTAIIEEAEADLRELLSIPDDYEVCARRRWQDRGRLPFPAQPHGGAASARDCRAFPASPRRQKLTDELK